jgi:hypothetical protein
MNAVAYIQEHPEMIQRQYILVWNEQGYTLKTVAEILNSIGCMS